jgi:hypothetical protein
MHIFPKKIRQWYQIKVIKAKVKECKRLKLITGKQQFLIKLNDKKLVIVTNEYLKAFNSTLPKNQPKMTYLDLCNISLYTTKV